MNQARKEIARPNAASAPRILIVEDDSDLALVRNADGLISVILAKRLVEHLERSGFVVMKMSLIEGGAALGRDTRADARQNPCQRGASAR
jgi:hypothetical protein